MTIRPAVIGSINPAKPLHFILDLTTHFLPPTLYFFLMFLFYPYRGELWMNMDEGINLSKALLVIRGFRLYEDIWNDQPPVLTYLLTFVLNIFGLRVNIARATILLLACLLVWASFQFLWKTWGKWHAVFGFLFLVILPEFARLSVSVMVGLPAIAFAMLSLFLLACWHRSGKTYWIILSAITLSISVMIKLFTGILVPLFLIGLVAGEWFKADKADRIRIFKPALAWGLTFTFLLAAFLLLLVKPENFNQLLENHLAASVMDSFQEDPEYTLTRYLQGFLPVMTLAAIGILDVVRRKNWLSLYLVGWMLAAYLLLSQHAPVWPHQQILITVPAALLAGAATGEAVNNLGKLTRAETQEQIAQAETRPDSPPPTTTNRRKALRNDNLASLACLMLLAYTMFSLGYNLLSQLQPTLKAPPLKDTTREVKIFNLVNRYAPETEWILTDHPIYAFWAGLKVPPDLAVFSAKRMMTGYLTEADIMETIDEYQPEQVFFGRFQFPLVNKYLANDYTIVYEYDMSRLYIRNDVLTGQE
jgi:hypothetical protein